MAYTLKFSQWIDFCIFHELVCILENISYETLFVKIETAQAEPAFSQF